MTVGEVRGGRCWRSFLTLLLGLIAALVAILSCTAASPSAAGTAETRVRASAEPAAVLVGLPEHIGAGQRLGEAADRVVSMVATGVAASGADDLARLTASQKKSLRSLRRQIEEHRSKLDAYRRDPDAFDNLGYLERAPSPEIRQRIIDGRIRHLENEINTFQDQIDKLLGGG